MSTFEKICYNTGVFDYLLTYLLNNLTEEFDLVLAELLSWFMRHNLKNVGVPCTRVPEVLSDSITVLIRILRKLFKSFRIDFLNYGSLEKTLNDLYLLLIFCQFDLDLTYL